MTRVEIVRPTRILAVDQKQMALRCGDCGKHAYVTFLTGIDREQRQQAMRNAIQEHRRIGCTKGEANARRAYTIEYPRL